MNLYLKTALIAVSTVIVLIVLTYIVFTHSPRGMYGMC